jgi:DNA-binding NarL/FixJ family response regulator
MKSKRTVLIADDHPAVRAGLGAMLKSADFEIVGEVETGRDAVEQTVKLRPDVVLLDCRMPKMDGLFALEQIRKKLPAQRVIMMSMYADRGQVAHSAAHGASEYVLKDAPQTEIVATVERVTKGEPTPESSLLRGIKRVTSIKGKRSLLRPLTQRETQVLQHISQGMSNVEIGKALCISVETVKEHVANLIKKIEVNDRTQAAVWAVKEGLI